MNVRQMFDLSGKVALITGGSRGLGLQIAEGLVEMGAKKSALAARRQDELATAAARLEAAGGEALTVAADLKGAAVFLCSDAARHVTGQCLGVDGGMSCCY